MSKYCLLCCLCLLGFQLSAQSSVPNDDCNGLVHLGVAPVCDPTVYTTRGATASDIGFGNLPSCFDGQEVIGDVWFSFTTGDTLINYVITVDGIGDQPITNPRLVLYRGGCEVDELAELSCRSTSDGSQSLQLNLSGLTPNVTYFLRVDHGAGDPAEQAGDFQICVLERLPLYTIDEGGSTECTGRLFDTGGASGPYQNNEDHAFVICPDDPHACINFNLEYYNIESLKGDQLIFYAGNSTNFNNIIAQFGGFDISGTLPVIEGGGGVCFSVQTDSDCLTVRLISDNSVTAEGFAGSWSCSTTPCRADKPITVDDEITEEQIVDFISTPQTVAEITDINCPDGAYGTFLAGDDTDLGLRKGLLLTTGNVNLAPGPNSIVDAGRKNNGTGDDDLDFLSQTQGDGSKSRDACIVELDVFAATNELTFEYIFGSEEYTEFVGREFNDIFAFFISGPGITGEPGLNDQRNIAVLPDGSTPVQINSVNHLLNWQYYRNNELGNSLEYDGLTADFFGQKKSLTARAQVTPCQTYHLKLAIADRGDFSYDSGVFISELAGGAPRFQIAYQSGIDFLIEECTEISDTVFVTLNNPLTDTVFYNVRIGGTATLGEDYELDIPPTITFLPGQTSFAFPIRALSDSEAEPDELIQLSLTNDFGCGEVTYTTLTIAIKDELKVDIVRPTDSLRICQDSSLFLRATGAADYFWSPVGLFEQPLADEQRFSPPNSTWVQVEGRVGSFCVAYDSVFVDVIDPQISISALDPTAICRGGGVRLEVTDNVSHERLSWMPGNGLSDRTSATPIARPDITTEYIARVERFGCTASDTILIDVDNFIAPILRRDTIICQNSTVALSTPFDTTGVDAIYTWTPAAGLDDPSSPLPLARPDVTTVYELFAQSENGACSESAEVRIEVIPADVDIQQADSIFLCLGESVDLTAITSTGSAEGLSWGPLNGSILDSTALAILVRPLRSTTYYTTFETPQCTVFDSVYVQIDSLPDVLNITADPLREQYCQGEVIVLTTPVYEPADYPDIEHQWIAAPGFESADDAFNMVLTATESFFYQRITRNNGCRDTISIPIEVITPGELFIQPQDTVICEGSSVRLRLQYSGNGSYSWQPAAGLSCTDCPDPLASPLVGMHTYTVTVQDETLGCPFSTAATVTVVPLPDIGLELVSEPPDTAYYGEPIRVTALADLLDFEQYNWEVNGEGLITGEPVLSIPPLPESQDIQFIPISLNVVTPEGCLLSAETGLTLVQPVKIPNVFTPNGDGINDIFRLYAATQDIVIDRFTIYNRWGEILYDVDHNQGWDGTYRGSPAPIDVYQYHIAYRISAGGAVRIVRGDLSLLR